MACGRDGLAGAGNGGEADGHAAGQRAHRAHPDQAGQPVRAGRRWYGPRGPPALVPAMLPAASLMVPHDTHDSGCGLRMRVSFLALWHIIFDALADNW